ncbi:MAG: ATP-binding protein [Desulfobacterales bacterium]|jgi:PAS domain S-box-containing protein
MELPPDIQELREELRRLEEVSTKNQRQYRALLKAMPLMMHALDAAGLILEVSDRWLDRMGCERRSVIGRPFAGFIAPEHRRYVVEVLLPALPASIGPRRDIYPLVTVNGRRIDIPMTVDVDQESSGQVPDIRVFLEDPTHGQETAEENTMLHRRLQMLHKMDAITTLAGGIAHQFNNNLSVITGHLDLLELDGIGDEGFLSCASSMRGAARRMSQLTEQLLAYARGGQYGAFAVPGATFVQDALSLLRHSLDDRTRLETHIEIGTSSIHIDVTQMQTALAAIVSNALEAMPTGGTIRVSCGNRRVSAQELDTRPGMRPGKYVLISVEDTGEGMDDNVRRRLFDPFFSTKQIGRGLGMAAVYGTIKSHGGWIGVESTPGEGTTVQLYLPTTAFRSGIGIQR